MLMSAENALKALLQSVDVDGKDQLDHHLAADPRAPAPVLRDRREKATLDLVPLARSRRNVTDADVRPGRARETLELWFRR